MFHHTAHIRLGFIYVHKYGVEEAVTRVCDQIQAFDRKFGDGTKYNQELTELSVRAIAYHMDQGSVSTFSDFLLQYPSMIRSFKGVIDKYREIELAG